MKSTIHKALELTAQPRGTGSVYRESKLAAVKVTPGARGTYDERHEFADGSAVLWFCSSVVAGQVSEPLAFIVEIPESPELTETRAQATRFASEASATLGGYVDTLEAQIAEIKALGDAISETAAKVREAAIQVRAVRWGVE